MAGLHSLGVTVGSRKGYRVDRASASIQYIAATGRLRTTMHQGSCHCGAVRLTLPATPTVATACNCSICRRTGGPWVYFEYGTVVIESDPDATTAYIWGDKTIRTLHCKTCGCVTHWEPLAPEPGAKQGVNLGNFDPELIASVRIRRFDGADTWQFIDD